MVEYKKIDDEAIAARNRQVRDEIDRCGGRELVRAVKDVIGEFVFDHLWNSYRCIGQDNVIELHRPMSTRIEYSEGMDTRSIKSRLEHAIYRTSVFQSDEEFAKNDVSDKNAKIVSLIKSADEGYKFIDGIVVDKYVNMDAVLPAEPEKWRSYVKEADEGTMVVSYGVIRRAMTKFGDERQFEKGISEPDARRKRIEIATTLSTDFLSHMSNVAGFEGTWRDYAD